MYNTYIAQGGGPNVRYVHCLMGGSPMYDLYIAQGGGPNVTYVHCPR